MNRRTMFRTMSMAMLAPFVARADPAKPLQQELNELWNKACAHRWSPTRDVCDKCGMPRQQEFEIRQHSVEVQFTPREPSRIDGNFTDIVADRLQRHGEQLKANIERAMYAKR